MCFKSAVCGVFRGVKASVLSVASLLIVDFVHYFLLLCGTYLFKFMQIEDIVLEIRSFNRFYVNLIGLLKADGYHSNYTLAETRVLLEINEATCMQASQIINKIQIDKSYLSRILRRLEKDGLVSRKRSDHDSRVVMLSLTQNGKLEIEKINHAASDLVKNQIERLDLNGCQQLVGHMKAITDLLSFAR